MAKPIIVKKLKKIKNPSKTSEFTNSEAHKSARKTAESISKSKGSNPTHFIEVE